MAKTPSQKCFESFTKTGKIKDYIKYLSVKNNTNVETSCEINGSNRLGEKDGSKERNHHKSN